MALRSAGDPRVPLRRAASLVEEACLGCGVCVSACRRDALRLVRRKERVIPPRDTARRVVRMALERGKLADLVFDDRALASHRILASLLGAILRLPPVERVLAREQVKSVYLEKAFETWERTTGHRG
jgi:ferredoxin